MGLEDLVVDCDLLKCLSSHVCLNWKEKRKKRMNKKASRRLHSGSGQYAATEAELCD